MTREAITTKKIAEPVGPFSAAVRRDAAGASAEKFFGWVVLGYTAISLHEFLD